LLDGTPTLCDMLKDPFVIMNAHRGVDINNDPESLSVPEMVLIDAIVNFRDNGI